MERITGSCYKAMLSYGVHHLDKHCAIVNDLNVFPVPDGDTGTNMVMTMKTGLHSLSETTDPLSSVAQSFANAAVFGARGNSGVIISQFFKGISEGFKDEHTADPSVLFRALDKGCEYAYAAVAKPVEGTILTVIKDATNAIGENLGELRTIDDVIAVFLKEARRSLENTPKLLPILEKAGVVDSGGSGVVYFFEGVQRYLNGEAPEAAEVADTSEQSQYVDYSVFHKNSNFEYGYCTETLLQLTVDREDFSYSDFVAGLERMGESLATSLEGDKVKIHIHTKTPEQILTYCHGFGEFLSLKIENMSVQHTQTTQKFLCSPNEGEGLFAVVAVAPNAMLQQMLAEMGADVVILSKEVPSSKDFLEAFEQVSAKEILVFPNSSNSILSAMQAGSLYKKAKITVLNCRSIAECYASLPIIDFNETDVHAIVSEVNDIIGNIYEVAVIHATKNIQYGNKTIVKNDYFALSGEEILLTGDQFERVALLTVNEVLRKQERSVLTLFYGKNVSEKQIHSLASRIGEAEDEVEICVISTQNPIYDLILSFE
ncbi:MAG: DAK2 domain-containing protein [Clostridia bacterium]|nr:DAK2 domain-containing protein [Clostridia bacterium]